MATCCEAGTDSVTNTVTSVTIAIMNTAEKVEIIPAINTEMFDEVERRVRLVEPYSSWVHLDIADGTFTKNTIWHDARDLVGFRTPLKIEAHLMVRDIDTRIAEWLQAPIARIIFHLEAGHDPNVVIAQCRKAGKQVGLAIVPDTSWIQLQPYWDRVDLVQTLGVHPGLAGQEIQPETYEKIAHLRASCPSCTIEADGGMKVGTARRAALKGANIIVAASAIFGSEDIGQAIDKLKRDVAVN